MIQHRRYPLPVWTGKTWDASSIIVGQDVDRGPGPVGIMPRHTPGGRLVKPEPRKGQQR